MKDWAWDPEIMNPEMRRASISGLRPSTNYRFYVYAMTVAGRGEVNFIDASTISPGREYSRISIRTHKLTYI